MSLSLVVLAAGKGTRFGGNKQFAEVGPDGQCLFEYSLFDAVRAGFDHVVFVVDKIEKSEEILARLDKYGFPVRIEFVVQELSGNIGDTDFFGTSPVRTKPWGTAHALLTCKQVVDNPFVTINADDYYGRNNFSIIVDYLGKTVCDPLQSAALPGYRLANTLSKSGGVNRGLCKLDKDGYLESVVEIENIRFEEPQHLSFDVPESTRADALDVRLDSIVSMNFWGFQPGIFKLIESAFQHFLQHHGDSLSAEIYVPEVVDQALKAGNLSVRVLPTADSWKGLTYAQDLAEVRKFIQQQKDAGFYP